MLSVETNRMRNVTGTAMATLEWMNLPNDLLSKATINYTSYTNAFTIEDCGEWIKSFVRKTIDILFRESLVMSTD